MNYNKIKFLINITSFHVGSIVFKNSDITNKSKTLAIKLS